jgi:hypothetical protein
LLHTFLSIGVNAAFSHHVAFFILDGGRNIGNVEERIEAETRRLVHLVLSLHGQRLLVVVSKQPTQFNFIQNTAYETIKNLHGPFKRMRFDGLVEHFKYVPRKIITVVQFRQIINKLETGHFTPYILGVQVRV